MKNWGRVSWTTKALPLAVIVAALWLLVTSGEGTGGFFRELTFWGGLPLELFAAGAITLVILLGRSVERSLAELPSLDEPKAAATLPVGEAAGELPELLKEPGVVLVAGPGAAPVDELASTAVAAGAAVLVVGRRSPGPGGGGWEGLAAPAGEGAVRAWLERVAVHRRALVVIADASALRGWAAAERVEARLARLLEALVDGPWADNLTWLVREPLAPDRVLVPDAVARRLLDRVDRVWLWDGALRAPTAGGGAAWWLVNRVGPALLSVRGQKWERLAWWGLVLAACTAAVATTCLPALAREARGTLLLGDGAESLSGSLWSNWWVHRWLSEGGDLLHSDLIYWPVGTDILPVFGNLLASFLAVPFQALWAYPDYWNPFTAAALVANGLAAALLARQAGADRAGALVAAVAFAVAPPILREVAAARQIQFWAFPLPLAIAAGLRALDSRARHAGALTGAAVALACLAWWFYGLFAAVVVGLGGLHRWLVAPALRPRIVLEGGRALRAWLPVLLAAGPLIAEANRGQLAGLTFAALPHEEAGDRLADLFLTLSVLHSARPEGWLEGPGLVAVVPTLAFGGLVAAWWWVSGWRDRYWVLVAVGAAVLAAGPYLAIRGGYATLPLAWLQAVIPFLSRLHYPERFLVIGALATAVLASLVLGPLTGRLRAGPRRLTVAAALVFAAAVPWMSGAASLPVYDFTVPRWVERLGADGASFEVPLHASEVAVLWQPLTGRPTVTGPGVARRLAGHNEFRFALQDDDTLAFLLATGTDAAGRDAIAQLRGRGLRYVEVDTLLIDGMLAEKKDVESQTLARLAARVDTLMGPPLLATPEVRVYRVPDPGEQVPEAGGGP